MVAKEGLDRGAGTNYCAAGRQTRWRMGADNGDSRILVGYKAVVVDQLTAKEV